MLIYSLRIKKNSYLYCLWLTLDRLNLNNK